MRSGCIQSFWARMLIEELARNGISQYCTSPGSRNTPLLLAVAENRSPHRKVHFDERGAGYFAVGYGKATGDAAALICTSGTAVANFLPAIVEAFYSDTPLIAITADRPASLRDSGANQTIDQIGIFGKFAKWSVDLPVPSRETPIESLLEAVGQAIRQSLQIPPGPVHINCQFDEPLTSDESEELPDGLQEAVERWRNNNPPIAANQQPLPTSSDADLREVGRLLNEASRPLIVAGLLDRRIDAASIIRFAERIQAPIMACVTSGLRFCGIRSQNLISHYDFFLRDSDISEILKPDLIIHLGDSVVSKSLLQRLGSAGCPYLHINETPREFNPMGSVTNRFHRRPDIFCDSLCKESRAADYLNLLRRADAVAKSTIASALSDDLDNELAVAHELIRALPDGSGLFLGNSMPIRDADGCGAVRDTSLAMCMNRGASGIDGTLATACGFAAGLHAPTAALIGDVATLHDLNSLSLAADSAVPVIVVVINNGGGGIFEFLPGIRRHECFEECFVARHDFDFERAASMFGLSYRNPNGLSAFRSDLLEAVSSQKSAILELKTDRQANARRHRAMWEQTAQAVREALSR